MATGRTQHRRKLSRRRISSRSASITDFEEGFAADPVQPEPGDGTANQSGSDGDQSDFWSPVFRSSAQCRREVHANDFSAHDFGDIARVTFAARHSFRRSTTRSRAIGFADGSVSAALTGRRDRFSGRTAIFISSKRTWPGCTVRTRSSGERRSESIATRQYLERIRMDFMNLAAASAYSPVKITSASGTHDIQVGDPLPDSLTGFADRDAIFLQHYAAADITPVGDKFNEAGVRREAYNFYFQDAWKATSKLTVSYGLRYEVNSRIHEATKRTSLPIFLGPDGKPRRIWGSYGDAGSADQSSASLRPGLEWLGTASWRWTTPIGQHTRCCTLVRAITTLLPNLWQDNFLTAAIPFVFAPRSTRIPGNAIPFQNTFVPLNLPTAYNTQGQPIFATGEVGRRSREHGVRLRAFSERSQRASAGNVQLLTHQRNREEFWQWIHRKLDRRCRSRLSATSSSTLRMSQPREFIWPRFYNPNGYGGACREFAPFTQFDSRMPCDRWIRIRNYHDQRIALVVSLAAERPDQNISSSGTRVAGKLHLFEVAGRYQFGAGRAARRVGNDAANRAAESVGSIGRERAIDL